MKPIIACLLTITLLPMAAVSARTWTSVSGSKLEAEYVGLDGSAVMLEKTDGSKLSIQLEKLSEADRSFVATLNDPAGDTNAKAAPAAKQDLLYGFVTYETATPRTAENFPTIPLRQAHTATYWGFQYGPSAEEVLYVAFDQPTFSELHDIAYLYSPSHPRYRTPVPLPGKKSKFDEDRVMRFAGIELQGTHSDLNASYSLEFVYGIERADILAVFVTTQLIRRGASTRFFTGAYINEEVAFEGVIPVTRALRAPALNLSTKNSFGKVDVRSDVRFGRWPLIPKSGMDKTILVEVVDTESGRSVEKIKVEIEEDAITNTRHGGAKTRLEKVKPGKTYDVNGSINLGPILGNATQSRTLKMPDQVEEEEKDNKKDNE